MAPSLRAFLANDQSLHEVSYMTGHHGARSKACAEKCQPRLLLTMLRVRFH